MITNSLTQVYDVLSTGATGRHDPWLEASQSVGGTEQQRRGEAFLSLAPLNFKPSHKSSIPNDPHNTSTSLVVRIATVVPLPTQKSKNKLSCVITKHIRTSTTFQFRKPWLSFCKPREQVLVQGAVCACALLRDLDSVLTPPFPRDAITIHSRLLADGKSSFQRENVAPPRYPSLLSNTENRLRFSWFSCPRDSTRYTYTHYVAILARNILSHIQPLLHESAMLFVNSKLISRICFVSNWDVADSFCSIEKERVNSWYCVGGNSGGGADDWWGKEGESIDDGGGGNIAVGAW